MHKFGGLSSSDPRFEKNDCLLLLLVSLVFESSSGHLLQLGSGLSHGPVPGFSLDPSDPFLDNHGTGGKVVEAFGFQLFEGTRSKVDAGVAAGKGEGEGAIGVFFHHGKEQVGQHVMDSVLDGDAHHVILVMRRHEALKATPCHVVTQLVGKGFAGNGNGRYQTGAFELSHGNVVIRKAGRHLIVGFDATNVPGRGVFHAVHETPKLIAELFQNGPVGGLFATDWALFDGTGCAGWFVFVGGAFNEGLEFLPNEVVGGLGGASQKVFGQFVRVAFHKLGGVVRDGTGKVSDPKLGFAMELLINQPVVFLVYNLDLVHKGFVVTLGTDTLLVQTDNDTQPSLQQVQNVRIVHDGKIKNLNSFRFVLLLDLFEIVQNILVLQLFVGVVDAELLKAIDLKTLKPKNVEQGNDPKFLLFALALITVAGASGFAFLLFLLFALGVFVNGLDQDIKDAGVDFLGEGVARFLGHRRPELDADLVVSRLEDAVRHGPLEDIAVNPDNVLEFGQLVPRRNDRPTLLHFRSGVLLKDEITQLQHHTERPQQSRQTITLKLKDFQSIQRPRPQLGIGFRRGMMVVGMVVAIVA